MGPQWLTAFRTLRRNSCVHIGINQNLGVGAPFRAYLHDKHAPLVLIFEGDFSNA